MGQAGHLYFGEVLHGLYLVINHFWHALRRKLGHDLRKNTRAGSILSGMLTFFAVAVAWVFFRAENFGAAMSMLNGMFAPHQASLATSHLFKSKDISIIITWFLSLSLILWLMPNLQQWMRYRTIPETDSQISSSRLLALIEFKPKLRWAIFTAALTGIAILGLTRLSEFLYFQF